MTIRLVFKNRHLSRALFRTEPAWHYDGVTHREPLDMTQSPAWKSAPLADGSRSFVSFTTRLTGEQLEALTRCAKRISLRFEAWAIVNTLVAGGYAEKGVGGIVTVTAKGEQYLRMYRQATLDTR